MFQPTTFNTNDYDKDSEKFAQELGLALERDKVVQISGIAQCSVDKLYHEAEEVFLSDVTEEFRIDTNLHYNLGRAYSQLRMSSSLDGHIVKTLFPDFAATITDIYFQLKRIAFKVNEALFRSIDREEVNLTYKKFYLLRYHENSSKSNPTRNPEHKDNDCTLSLPASQDGLEGFVKGRWVQLSPESGNLILIAGKTLERVSEERFEALEHRVVNTSEDDTPRYAGLFLFG